MQSGNENIRWLSVPEEFYKADLELLSKYQSFSAELLRLSLLGLSVFGILLNAKLLNTPEIKVYIIASIFAFGASAGFSLAHRFYSTEGLLYHILVIRKGEKEFSKYRNRIFKKSAIFMGGASIALGAGAISLCFGFIQAAL